MKTISIFTVNFFVMKNNTWLAKHVLTAVLITALVIPCVHTHEETHETDVYGGEAWNAHVPTHHVHPHDHSHEHASSRQQFHKSHAHRQSDHWHHFGHTNPVADLLLKKLERTHLGHTHQVTLHAHFFNLLQEGKTTKPHSANLAVVSKKQTRAADLATAFACHTDRDVAPALSFLTYIALITNIPPPSA